MKRHLRALLEVCRPELFCRCMVVVLVSLSVVESGFPFALTSFEFTGLRRRQILVYSGKLAGNQSRLRSHASHLDPFSDRPQPLQILGDINSRSLPALYRLRRGFAPICMITSQTFKASRVIQVANSGSSQACSIVGNQHTFPPLNTLIASIHSSPPLPML